MKKKMLFMVLLSYFLLLFPLNTAQADTVTIYLFNQQLPDKDILVKKDRIFVKWNTLVKAFKGSLNLGLKDKKIAVLQVNNELFASFEDFLNQFKIKNIYSFKYYKDSNTYLINRLPTAYYQPPDQPQNPQPALSGIGAVDGTVSWTNNDGTVASLPAVHLTLTNIDPPRLIEGKIQGGQTYHAFTDQRGVFTFSDVLPGSYQLTGQFVQTVKQQDYNNPTVTYSNNMVIRWSVQVEVKNGENTRIHLNNSNGKATWEQ